MKVVKCVTQNIQFNDDINYILENFRWMVNEAIRVALDKNITSKFKLQKEVYYDFKIGLYSSYILGAFECACAMVKNYKKKIRKKKDTKKPYVLSPFMKLNNQSYKIDLDKKTIRIPIMARKYIYIGLCDYVIRELSQSNIKFGAITLTKNILSISYSKDVEMIEPVGYIGIDTNLGNLTCAMSDGTVKRYDLSEVCRIKNLYRHKISKFRRHDIRKRTEIQRKYGAREKNRVNQIIHKVTKEIVTEAKEKNYGIIMEDIKEIRKKHRKDKCKGKELRARLNNWSFRKIQYTCEYKAIWEGLPVIYISPHNTSSVCAICGSKVTECADRMVCCSKCGLLVDRDVNASKNILACGSRFDPDDIPDEARKQSKDAE